MDNPLKLNANFSIKHAIVVDDGPVERLAGKSMLEKLGITVEMAACSEDALAIMSKMQIDLVLCDISMPGMDGLQLLELSRSQPNPPIFIMSTNHEDAEYAFTALRNGAYGYLNKPVRFEHLTETVKKVEEKKTQEIASAKLTQGPTRQDTLTNLLNKDEFCRLLTIRLEQLNDSNQSGALLFFKVTGLNHINHSYGRAEGNRLLQMVSSALAQHVRDTDLLARFSGDLFSIYLNQIEPSLIPERAAEIATSVEGIKMLLAGEAFSFTLIVGGASAQARTELEDLLNRADFALHLAREHDRNRIHIYTEADEVHKRELSQQLITLSLVRAALNDQQRMTMHYQPIINLITGKISHYEALLRLLDENGKPCNTGALVKTCEVFGLIGRLDYAVVDACLNDIADLPKESGVAINLSGKSIGDPALLQFIETRVKELNIDPSRIIFELTETAAFYNLDEVRYFVGRIKDLGCRFALDDFGVGFSSFYYIKELDFDYLKLDGSFIANLPRNPNDQVFVRAMVEISRVFDMTVIAEWVEDQETASILKEYGVALGQGYYFGKPAPMPQSTEKSVLVKQLIDNTLIK